MLKFMFCLLGLCLLGLWFSIVTAPPLPVPTAVVTQGETHTVYPEARKAKRWHRLETHEEVLRRLGMTEERYQAIH